MLLVLRRNVRRVVQSKLDKEEDNVISQKTANVHAAQIVSW